MVVFDFPFFCDGGWALFLLTRGFLALVFAFSAVAVLGGAGASIIEGTRAAAARVTLAFVVPFEESFVAFRVAITFLFIKVVIK